MPNTSMPNWAEIWDGAMEESSWIKLLKEQASSMVAYWDKHSSNYGRRGAIVRPPLLDKLEVLVGPESNVLDVGAGTGQFAIPLAKKTKSVVAVEPSAGMLSYLRRRAAEEKLSNIEFVNQTWEGTEVPGKYDLLLCSNAIYFVADIKRSLLKMIEATRGHLLLTIVVYEENDIFSKVWSVMKDTRYNHGPDYSCLFNLLRELGLYPSVEISEANRQFSSLDEAVAFLTTHFDPGEVVGKEEQLRCLIKPYSKATEDGPFVWDRMWKSALLSARVGG